MRSAKLGFKAPSDLKSLKVIQELDGDAGTDFGVPGLAAKADDRAVDDDELRRLQSALRACWRAFDAAVEHAGKKKLAPGARGGGRDLDKIVSHVVEAEGGYLRMIGLKAEKDHRQAILDGLAAAAHGETEKEGPRGGKRWNARYFTRRVAWHVLDHAWEIEDRTD